MKDHQTDIENEDIDNQWHLRAPGTRVGINVAGLSESGRADIKVAIVDTGIDYTHPALAHALDLDDARDFDSTIEGQPRDVVTGRLKNDYDAHGTALAGIIAAKTDDREARGIRGIAPSCKVVPIRVSSNFDPKSLEAALRYAAKVGDVVLLARTLPEDLRSVVEEVAQDVPIVCASGNNGRNALAFPASAHGTIAVGACNEHGWRSTYSQHGPGLDVVAPSNDVSADTRTLRRQSEEDAYRRADAEAAEVSRRDRALVFREKKNRLAGLVRAAQEAGQGAAAQYRSLHALEEHPQGFVPLDQQVRSLQKAADDLPDPAARRVREKARALLGPESQAVLTGIAREWAHYEIEQHLECVRKRLRAEKRVELHVDRLGSLAIATTDNQGSSGYNIAPEGDFCHAKGTYTFGGTSAAAAHIAGVVALMLSAAMDAIEENGSVAENERRKMLQDILNPESIRSILTRSASLAELHQEVDRESGKPLSDEFGAGLIDAEKAVAAARTAVENALKPAAPTLAAVP